MTTEIANAVFGRGAENGALTTWEELAARANHDASALARMCGVSLRTVQRHFRKNYELSVSEWLKRLRLELAMKRLQEGAQVKSVAYDIGFKEVAGFSRAFKESYGISPSCVYRAEVSSPCRSARESGTRCLNLKWPPAG